VIFECLLCGRRFASLRAWYRHLQLQHPDAEPGWAWAMRMEGRRVSVWRVYKDCKLEGVVRAWRSGSAA